MRKTLLLLTSLLAATTATARDINVKEYRYHGPSALQRPLLLDSLDAAQHAWDTLDIASAPLSIAAAREAPLRSGSQLPRTPASAAAALHLIGFDIAATGYATVRINVEGLKHFTLFLDGKEAAAATDLPLIPATHEVVIKALTTAVAEADSMHICVATTDSCDVSVAASRTGGRLYSLDDVLHARRYNDVSLSPDGRWMIVATSQVLPGGQTQRRCEVRDVQTGRIVTAGDDLNWMPRANLYYYTRTGGDGRRQLVATNPATLAETILAADLPECVGFDFTPTEDALICYNSVKGPKERSDVYEVIHPDDRQPGWRNRYAVLRHDLRTGITQPLTQSHDNIYAVDVSADGRYVLLHRNESRLAARPLTLTTLLRLDMTTMTADTLLLREGFISTARFSPDAREVLISASPEAFDGIGKNVDEGQTPSMIDIQLYVLDVATHKVRALTKDFNPSVQQFEWSKADGMVYFMAEDRDSVNLFRLNPASGDIRQIELPEELTERFAIANAASQMVIYAQSASNSDRLYALDLKSLRIKGDKLTAAKGVRLLEDLSAETLRGIRLGECRAWTWRNEGGDDICCRYYLPPFFDPSKRYPMIVNYYGGCSPTSRDFESRYPHHAYAAQGYVVLVVNPSGATGFGQRFSARHVNTAGRGPAEDIIGAVRAFCESHSFVRSDRIGCIGASYGGFMTQYLLTQTDLFAAGISHAGISDHTSYWGNGYWGYSYSEVSMANSYPWKDTDLYVKQSPLYMADRIHTPLLLIHGDADHNVPVGESIQLYNALRLLERPTALVLVSDQDHHILDYEKRRRWQQTIDAWFARWLKDDPAWWNSMYPHKDL